MTLPDLTPDHAETPEEVAMRVVETIAPDWPERDKRSMARTLSHELMGGMTERDIARMLRAMRRAAWKGTL